MSSAPTHTAPEVDAKTMAQGLARRFKERASALGFKGKKRDDAALDFWVGAASALTDINHPTATAISIQAALVISVRGYIGVCAIAEGRD